MILQSTVWSRLGVSYLASLNCELYLMKYTKDSPIEDIVKALCRGAYLVCCLSCLRIFLTILQLSQKGRFDEALEKMDQVDPENLRTLRIYQYWATYLALIKLTRAIYRYVVYAYV